MSWDNITKALAAMVGAAAGLLGEWNVLLTVLAIFMVIDYLTGLIVAWRGKSPKTVTGGVSSKAGFDGLIRKFFIMVVILVATLLDVAIGNSTRVFQTAATMYYIANEGISILENTALMGVKYPAFIIKALEALRDKSDTLDDGRIDDTKPEE
jgi:toxin secretion/phage lysis holin